MVHAAHYALFRRMFADRDIAAAALAGSLPAEVAALIDFTTLELRPTSFVDKSMRSFHADLVFSAKIAGRDGRVVLLLEHQSSSDPFMPLRLLHYSVLLWDSFRRDDPAARRLPLFVPVVWYQGPGKWGAPREMIELLDLTNDERAVLGRYAPRMRFELDELALLDAESLRGRAMSAEATLAMAALRDVRNADDVREVFGSWHDLLRDAARTERGLRAIATIVGYILQVHGGLDLQELSKLADHVIPGSGASVMATAQELIERGRAEGRVEGRAEGEARGRAEGRAEGLLAGRRAALAHMLRLKFAHAFTVALQHRVEAAGAEALDRWEERLLDATCIDDVLR